MELKTAIHLIEKGIPSPTEKSVWADLGAGKGLFSKALSSKLPSNSKIIAVDRDQSVLRSIKLENDDMSLETIAADFTSLEILPQQLKWGADGKLTSLYFASSRISYRIEIETCSRWENYFSRI